MLSRLILSLPLMLCLLGVPASAEGQRPQPRPADLVIPPPEIIPDARWDFRREGDVWTRAALDALKTHGAPLVNSTPADIAQWCPGYRSAPPTARRAFWVGFLSALAKYESTWKPRAVGGGGRWYGLLQILPSTARGYGCRARSGSALLNGAANLSCAVRIMAVTVPRDGAILGEAGRWRGVAGDWGPLRSAAKRRDMAEWLRSRAYCQRMTSPRPKPRPSSGLVAQEAAKRQPMGREVALILPQDGLRQ